MIRLIFAVSILIGLLSCKTGSKGENKSVTIKNFKEDTVIVKEVVLKEKDISNIKQTPKIQQSKILHYYAYSDSVKIHAEPNDSSELVGILNFSESIKRFEKSSGYENQYVTDGSGRAWLAVEFNYDTAWISNKEDVSTELDIDTIRNLVFMDYYGFCPYGGEIGCYNKSKLYNTKCDSTLFEGYTTFNVPEMVNDSLLIYNPGGFYNYWAKIWLYNLHQDKLMFSSKGVLAKKSNIENAIYFVRKQDWDKPVQFVKYNYSLDLETVLYEEQTDSTYYCHRHMDGGDCDDYNIELADSIEYITFETHRISTTEDFEVGKIYQIKIDNKGNFYSRSEK